MGKATTLAVLLVLALPLPAAAARAVAPPGNAEADQYFETLPDSGGSRSPSPATPGQAVREGELNAATERALARRGAAGRAVANVVAKTAPAGAANGGGSAGVGPGSGVQVPQEQGLGALFPLILVAGAAAAIAFALARRHRHATR